MGANGMHARVQSELAHVIARHFSLSLKGCGDQERCLRAGEKEGY